MKKIAIFGMILTMLTISSCGSGSSSIESMSNDFSTSVTSTEKSETEYSISDIEKSEISKRESQVSAVLSKAETQDYDTLIKRSYPLSAFLERGWFFRLYNPVYSYQINLPDVEEDFPVECLRRTGDSTAYTIYKTDEGGMVYMFYVNRYSNWTLYRMVYLETELSHQDFLKLKVGDSIEDVEKIDSGLRSMRNVIKSLPNTHEIVWLSSYVHLLRDGNIVIQYTEADDKSMRIENITFHEDFKHIVNEFDIFNRIDYDDYTILPQDYPE